jgi:hypothetical protein
MDAQLETAVEDDWGRQFCGLCTADTDDVETKEEKAALVAHWNAEHMPPRESWL